MKLFQFFLQNSHKFLYLNLLYHKILNPFKPCCENSVLYIFHTSYMHHYKYAQMEPNLSPSFLDLVCCECTSRICESTHFSPGEMHDILLCFQHVLRPQPTDLVLTLDRLVQLLYLSSFFSQMDFQASFTSVDILKLTRLVRLARFLQKMER